jgi:hypothetical protein
MSRPWLVLVPALFVGALFVGGCGARAQVPIMADLARVHDGAAAKDAERFAPQAFAEAEGLRKEAEKAWTDGDDVGASLTAERAIAAYDRARALARLAHADSERAAAEAERARNETELQQLATTRAELVRDGKELEKKITIASEARLPPPSGPADATREAARLVAARSLAVQARLLCGAAGLLAPGLTGLKEAEDATAELEKKLEGAGARPAPIDDAGKRRVACLDALTRARRTADAKTVEGDALLTELSAASAAGGSGWQPSRDERGVVVTLRDVFAGEKLSTGAEGKLKELGRVASAHPGVGVQVVTHDAAESKGGDARASLAAKAVIAGGIAQDKVKSESAGTRAPIIDPNDAKNRNRNARVEIVFVTK